MVDCNNKKMEIANKKTLILILEEVRWSKLQVVTIRISEWKGIQ